MDYLHQKIDKVGLSTAMATVILWSSAFAFIRMCLQYLTAGQLTLARFLVASTAFAIYTFVKRVKMPDRADIPWLIFLGMTGISIYHTALNYGQVTVSAGTASFIIAASPGITAILSAILLKEEVTPRRLSGFGVSLSGVLILTIGSKTGLVISTGALFILLASVCISFFFIVQKRLLAKYSAIELTAYATWIGTLPLLLFSKGLLTSIANAPLSCIASIGYIGVFPAAIAYVTWAITLHRLPVSQASSILYFNPVLAVMWGYLIMKEVPTPLQLIGGFLALVGVVLVNTKQTRGISTGTNRATKNV